MLSDENFRREYQASEDSVPVNDELKKRLIAMAKACEKGEMPKEVSSADIKADEFASGKEKRNIRHIIIKTAALAACFAVCVCSIPKINDIYFSRTDDNEPDAQITATAAPTVEKTAAKEEDKTEDTPRVMELGGTEKQSGNEAGGERVNNIKAVSTASTGPAAVIGENKASAMVRTDNAAVTDVSVSKSGNVTSDVLRENGVQGAIEKSSNERMYMPDNSEADSSSCMIKSTDVNNEVLTGRDEFNKRLTLLDRQRAKLDSWDCEIKAYVGRDETLDRSYEDFSGDKTAYNKAADEYTAKYTAADTETELQNGIREYDAELGDDSSLFNECRESYRKSANYIEMSGMNEDAAQTPDSEKTREDAGSDETEKAAETEEENEETGIED
ncbi:MAG: hypothetical protein PUD92_00905 [Clostridiales bacterium]|nr:hypothetical protein [Clostridiales bacterium]